jgi:hypothetical protein
MFKSRPDLQAETIPALPITNIEEPPLQTQAWNNQPPDPPKINPPFACFLTGRARKASQTDQFALKCH